MNWIKRVPIGVKVTYSPSYQEHLKCFLPTETKTIGTWAHKSSPIESPSKPTTIPALRSSTDWGRNSECAAPKSLTLKPTDPFFPLVKEGGRV